MTSRRVIAWSAAGLSIAALGVLALYFFVLRVDSPPPVSLGDAIASVGGTADGEQATENDSLVSSGGTAVSVTSTGTALAVPPLSLIPFAVASALTMSTSAATTVAP